MPDLTKNPLLFLPADAGTTDHLAGVFPSGRLFITGIRWVGATAVGHTVLLHDNSGRVIWGSLAPQVNFVDESRIEYWVRNGLRVNTLSSGLLMIYLSER